MLTVIIQYNKQMYSSLENKIFLKTEQRELDIHTNFTDNIRSYSRDITVNELKKLAQNFCYANGYIFVSCTVTIH